MKGIQSHSSFLSAIVEFEVLNKIHIFLLIQNLGVLIVDKKSTHFFQKLSHFPKL